jgi:tRNA(His) guanylyltransferase
MKDPIGDRLKTKYEDVFRVSVPQQTYGLVRIDGKAFHTFTKGLQRPYCPELGQALDTAAKTLCKEMMGCRFAYGQSDEYSFLFTDFDTEKSEMWFSGNAMKIASVSASIFTAAFNEAWSGPIRRKSGTFDSRVFVIPPRRDVFEYFRWRQADASRNSLRMLASCHFSHKELQGKGASDLHEMLHKAVGVNWNDCASAFRRGRVVKKVESTRTVSYIHRKTKETNTQTITESVWSVDQEIPVFTRNKAYLESMIPVYDPQPAAA